MWKPTQSVAAKSVEPFANKCLESTAFRHRIPFPLNHWKKDRDQLTEFPHHNPKASARDHHPSPNSPTRELQALDPDHHCRRSIQSNQIDHLIVHRFGGRHTEFRKPVVQVGTVVCGQQGSRFAGNDGSGCGIPCRHIGCPVGV